MQSVKRLMLGGLLVVSLSLMGCLATTSTSGISTCCDSFQIIRPSQEDTRETKRQIYEHNEVYEALCEEE